MVHLLELAVGPDGPVSVLAAELVRADDGAVVVFLVEHRLVADAEDGVFRKGSER